MAESMHLARLAEASLARLGDHDALVFEGATIRAGEIQRRAQAVAGALADLGVGPGDRVVVLMANCPEVLVTYHAIWRAGAAVTPVVFLVTTTELHHILVDSAAVALVTTTELLNTALEAAADVGTLRVIAVAGDVVPAVPDARVQSFGALESGSARAIVDRDDGDLAALLYTGGTTGRAKGVALTHANLWSTAHSAWRLSHVPGMNRVLIPLPLSHAYGLIVTVVAMHSDEPGVAVVQRWFNAAEWVSLCAEHRAQRTALVPAMMQMLLAEPLEAADLSALQYVTSGAAPLPLEVLREFERRIPSCRVLEGYGCTESAAVISSNPPGRRRAGSVGVPIDGCTVQVTGPGGEPLDTGADGEIWVRGPGVMSGYWNAPDETAAALAGGWLHTGDVGHLDADGYLWVVDRMKDLIIRGGFNVFPRDVEDVLSEHPGVAMAGVVGRPDPRLGEEVVAFVSLHPGATVDDRELIAFARARLSPTKAPREVHVVPSIPLTSVGKLDRKRLRSMLADLPAATPLH